MDYNLWTQKAIEIIKNKIIVGHTFKLKDLFEGHSWQSISSTERRKFGYFFSNEVRENRVKGVLCAGKSKEGHNLYKKS